MTGVAKFLKGAAPSTPSAGYVRVYAKTDGYIYGLDESGVETQLSNSAALNTATTKLPDIDVTPSAGALTVALNTALYFDFRSTTATDGTPTTVLCDPADLVIPDGATLGSVTTVAADIAVLMINNAGTAEFAVVNLAGGINLDQSGVISTTAIGTGSDSANVIYSTTARTNVAYKVVKRFRAVNTAGSWGSPAAVDDGILATMLNSSGLAPMYACRAWVNFNGTGTVAIRAGGNVSSITDNGVGDYTVNFIAAMPDTNYSMVVSGNSSTLVDPITTASPIITGQYTTKSVSSGRVINMYGTGSSSIDLATICVSIFR